MKLKEGRELKAIYTSFILYHLNHSSLVRDLVRTYSERAKEYCCPCSRQCYAMRLRGTRHYRATGGHGRDCSRSGMLALFASVALHNHAIPSFAGTLTKQGEEVVPMD